MLAALSRGAGNSAVCRLLARQPVAPPAADPRTRFPWVGKVHGTWAAALRKTPAKDAGDPHANTLVDLPRGTEVRIVNRKGGWLQAEVTHEGSALQGYISQELVAYVGESAYELPEITVSVDVPTVPEAFVELKRAETGKTTGSFTPSEDEQDRIDLAVSVLRDTKKYVVDESTYKVDFDRSARPKVQITTIEDFILFVEQVERAYPAAKPAEVAAEIRQVWFSDVNWELLVASQGIRSGGDLVDIETEAPIATAFDMKQIAPPGGSLQLTTPMGSVDVGHLLAGIDANLSGAPTAYPEGFLEEREGITGGDHDTFKSEAKYDALKAAHKGDVRDFTTWSGDLGQAYAEYLIDRHLLGNPKATLADWVARKSPPEELLGDIHGYIAVEVWKSVPAAKSPTGGELKISNILRDLYLVSKPKSTYASHFERVSRRSPADHAKYITERTVAFARTWYAKRSYEEKGADAWRPSAILKEKSDEFDDKHKWNEIAADPQDKVEVLVEDLLRRLGSEFE